MQNERGILVAISIPVFTKQLEKAREASDLANLRAAYAAGVAEYLDDTAFAEGYYDTGKGSIVKGTGAKGNKAGKGTETVGSAGNEITIGGFDYKPNASYVDKAIKVTVTKGAVSVSFVES